MKSYFNFFKPTLIVNREIRGSNSSDFLWTALSNDPQFLIPQLPPLFGWFMIELDIDCSSCDANACIYLDTGNGFNEEQKFFFPLKNNKKSKRIVYFPRNLKGLRFDPVDQACQFSINEFVFVWLLPWFAYDRMIHRIANMHFRFVDKKKLTILKEIIFEAKGFKLKWPQILMANYDQTFFKSRIESNYLEWIATHESGISLNSSAWTIRPKISILLPVFNADEKFLRECIESVISQTYDFWELCIVDDASTFPYIKPILEEASQSDGRIKVIYRGINGNISEATNTALSCASGEFITFLDHDDLLAKHALSYFVDAINAHPNSNIFYSDEDKIDENGQRYDPHFKPDWNPDLLYSHNYICHMVVVRQSLVNQIGGFRSLYDGSQDHDFLLRLTQGIKPELIRHLPFILYHWRSVKGSTASDPSAKKYTTEAGIRSLQFFHSDCNNKVNVNRGFLPNTYRNQWQLPSPNPLVSIIIPTRDAFSHLKNCVESIIDKTSYSRFEIIIINNQSICPDALEYIDKINELDFVHVYDWNEPFNYSKINNFAVELAKGSVLCLLNNDVEVINDEWLTEMVSHAVRKDIGCVGAKLIYPNDTIQHGGVILGIGGVAGHSHKYFSRHDNGYFSRLKLVQNMSAVTGACLVLRKNVFDHVGGLDAENLAVAFNDVDLCLKVQARGYRNLWTPYAELYHHESISRGADDNIIKRNRAKKEAVYMREKWNDILDNDPAYNRNLTLLHEDFTLRGDFNVT